MKLDMDLDMDRVGDLGRSWSWVLGMELILHEARSVLEAYERMDLRYYGFLLWGLIN